MKFPHSLLNGALIALLLFSFSSCKSEEPVQENDQELITDVTLNFQELDSDSNPIGLLLSFEAKDPEGIETGQTLEVETVKLKRNKKYLLSIEVHNSLANEDITEEILEDADEHQFFFLGSAFTGSNPPLTYAYNDADGVLLGLKGIVTTAAEPITNNAELRLILRHALDKNYPGIENPSFENYTKAGGETDLEIPFPVVIE